MKFSIFFEKQTLYFKTRWVISTLLAIWCAPFLLLHVSRIKAASSIMHRLCPAPSPHLSSDCIPFPSSPVPLETLIPSSREMFILLFLTCCSQATLPEHTTLSRCHFRTVRELDLKSEQWHWNRSKNNVVVKTGEKWWQVWWMVSSCSRGHVYDCVMVDSALFWPFQQKIGWA